MRDKIHTDYMRRKYKNPVELTKVIIISYNEIYLLNSN